MLPTSRGPLGYFLQPLDIVPVDCKPLQAIASLAYSHGIIYHPISGLFCDFGCSIVSFLAVHGCRFKVATPTAFLAQHISTYLNMHEFQDTVTAPQHHKMVNSAGFVWPANPSNFPT